MFSFESRRYGGLQRISAKTDGRCHICHERADLCFYGPPGLFGDETVTVDHLLPQAHGGDDDPDNLWLAHACCNSSRGTRAAQDVRMELTGTDDAPLGVAQKNAISLGAGGLGYLGGGVLFADRNPDGSRAFNHRAALISALTLTVLTRLTL